MVILTTIEEAVQALPPHQQRRMARMVLAGAKFRHTEYGSWCASLPWPNTKGQGVYSEYVAHFSLDYMVRKMWAEFVTKGGTDGDQQT